MAVALFLTSGEKIRELRKERGLSIEALANEAGITAVALSNIELKSAAPQRSTILKLLDCLDSTLPIPVEKRREITDAFGYIDIPGVPNQHDIDKAVQAWQKPFKNTPYPAYILDRVQRIHDWNDQMLAFIGEDIQDLKGRTIFDLLFDGRSRGVVNLVNEEEVVTKMVRHMRKEYRPYMDEEWCKQCLADARAKYPLFGELFDTLPDEGSPALDLRATGPIILRDKEGHTLHFQIVGIDLISDPRFGVVQYIPLDKETAQILTNLFS
ncbi:MAG: helix-turn-helix domain-containing protein [bacterium]